MIKYMYLHGFSSSNQAKKAIHLKDYFKKHNVELIMPMLDSNDFANTTLTKQISKVKEIINNSSADFILIGSSMGGLIATIIAENESRIKKLILLAPALNLASLWNRFLSKQELATWQRIGFRPVYYSLEKRYIDLKYSFFTDLQLYKNLVFKRDIRALIIHGTLDETIPIDTSRNYATTHIKSNLIEVNDDHSLEQDLDYMCDKIHKFLHEI